MSFLPFLYTFLQFIAANTDDFLFVFLGRIMSFSWLKCVICQNVTKEDLRCPLKALGANVNPKSVYESFLANVAGFKEIDKLPVCLALAPEVNVDVLVHNKACWHKSCILQFSSSKLEKARDRKRKRDAKDESNEETRSTKSRRLSADNNRGSCTCLLCGEEGGQLHEVSTFATDENLRHMITELQDPSLLPSISDVDLIAAEAKYHLKCLTELRNRYRGHVRKAEGQYEREEDKLKESQAFVELINYIDSSVNNGTLIFHLAELHSLYVSRLKALGIPKQVNRTRLTQTFPTGKFPASSRTKSRKERNDSFQESNPRYAERRSSTSRLYR